MLPFTYLLSYFPPILDSPQRTTSPVEPNPHHFYRMLSGEAHYSSYFLPALLSIAFDTCCPKKKTFFLDSKLKISPLCSKKVPSASQCLRISESRCSTSFEFRFIDDTHHMMGFLLVINGSVF